MKKAKKALSVLLSVLMLSLSVVPAALAAPSYPDGITKEQVLSAIPKTDTAINSLSESIKNKDLKELVLSEIYSDDMLSSIMAGFYSMIEENAESISSAGIKVTVSDVSECLGDYPDVQKKLSAYRKWNEVKLEKAHWGVDGKSDFIKAMGSIFSPFNELLYMLLCDGYYSLNAVIGIEGDFGYENAIIPVLKALGCEKITDSQQFYKDAEKNKNSMVENILSDVFFLLEDILIAPCDKMTDVLPSIAYFLNNGGFDAAVSKLIAPLKLQIFNISTFIKIEFILSFIKDSKLYTQNFTRNFNNILGNTELKMAEIDLEELASCGTVSGDIVIADKADTFIILLRWIVDTLKLNKDNFGDLSSGEMPAEITEAISGFMSKDTDETVKGIISLFTQNSAKILEHTWTFAEYTPVAVTYTPNLTAEKFQRVADGIDDLINEFILEGGEYENTRQALEPQIYSNKLLTEIVKGIYGAFESEEMKGLSDLLGLDFSTYAVANGLKGSAFSSARYTLYHNAKWSNIKSINWGFKDGNREGFVNALCQALSPLEPILTMLLAEGKITILDSIDLYGSNGYNTAIIPILEALGCSPESIKTYEEFKAAVSKGELSESLVNALISLVERVLDKPVYTIIELLPNLLYFVKTGGLETAIENLLYPFTEMMSSFGMENAFDISELTNKLDSEKMIKEMLGDSEIKIENFDINQFMTMGQLVSVQSKRTLNGQPVTVSYVQADKSAIIVTLMRFIAEMMKTPGNEDILMSFMGSDDNNMFSDFSGGMGEELKNMTTDETVEWLYKIFFRERAVAEEKVTEKYLPMIIYEKEEKDINPLAVILPIALILTVTIIVIKKKRKKNVYAEDNDILSESENEELREV